MRKAGTDSVPRCQRTFSRLSGDTPCPFCPNAETYASLRDTDLHDYAARAFEETTHLFGKPQDVNHPTHLWLGLRPECVWEPANKAYDIYLQTGSSPEQLRLQLGHEIFHRVCSRGRVFHWTHEMLACVISLHLLRVYGFGEYADVMEKQYTKEAELLSTQTMMALDLWASPDFPPGFYGRAYVTGAALVRKADVSALRRLAHANPPDKERWLSDLLATGESMERPLERTH